MNVEDRLKAAGWKTPTPVAGGTGIYPMRWTQDGIDWFTEDEALVVVLTAERDAAIARAERAEAERTEYLAALWLCAYETAWVRTPGEYNLIQPWPMEEGPPRLLVMCSDTFAWACADCEPCEYPRATEVFRIMQTEGWPGVARWVQAQREARGEHAEFIEPVQRDIGTLDAMRARAEAAEALAASRPEITPEVARDYREERR